MFLSLAGFPGIGKEPVFRTLIIIFTLDLQSRSSNLIFVDRVRDVV
jgi:hypothetical protein